MKLSKTLLIPAFGLLLTTLVGCPFSDTVGQQDKIGELAVYMQQRYRREIQADGFEINYIPAPPSKIRIMVRYKPQASRSLIGALVDSAKEIIRRKGFELYQLQQVDVDVEMKEIDAKATE